MAIPKYNEMYGLFLKGLEDGKIRTIKEIKQYIASILDLSDDDLSLMLPSGLQKVFDNRIGWTRTYLKKAGLIESPSRAHFVLTEAGRKALTDVDIIDDKYLQRYPSFRAFLKREEIENNDDEPAQTLKSPEETLEDAFSAINVSLSDDLMAEILKLSPTDFEHLVMDLLLHMGYGGGVEDAGLVTQATNDGGIDGIIKEDQLGFSSIYIQAKKWDPQRTVDRPEIDTFIGALTRNHANKGLFITTASFSSGAKEAAKAANIVLVDGTQLTKLMIKHNLGVSVSHVYEVKRLDSDYFTEGF